MPGLGFRTALKILTIVGDGAAFPTAGHLAAYAGLAPVTRRSGTSIKGETRSQRGNHALKSALFLEPPPIWRTPPVGGVRVIQGSSAGVEEASVLR
jgi:transposase